MLGHATAKPYPRLREAMLAASIAAAMAGLIAPPANADDVLTARSSPWHRAQDGNGRTIPCVCSDQGRLLPLGATACLQTPMGWQMARCDLKQNVTSWVPTGASCQASSLGRSSSPT